MRKLLIGCTITLGVLIMPATALAATQTTAGGLQSQELSIGSGQSPQASSGVALLQPSNTAGDSAGISLGDNDNVAGVLGTRTGLTRQEIIAEVDGKQSAGISNWLLAFFSAIGLIIILVGYGLFFGYGNTDPESDQSV